jgi:Group XII secretory phospholipase A2 precursor (PLA2G12)
VPGAFDRLAQAAADGVSRRTLVRMGAAAAFAAVVPEVVWRAVPAHAGVVGIRGTCPNVTAVPCGDTAIQVPWTPLCDPATYATNGQIPVPSGNASTFNGCGPEKGIDLGPFGVREPGDRPAWLADFEQACNHHDCCYGTCLKSKAECDSTFLEELLEACAVGPGNLISGIGAMYCAEIAGIYFGAVAGGGGDAYTDAQKDACACCQDRCRNVQCGNGQVCEPTTGDCRCAIEGMLNCGSYCASPDDQNNCGGCGVVCDGYCYGDGNCVTL